MTFKDDSKIMKVEAPSVEKTKARVPNTNRILDNVLESVGLQREDGGSA